MEIIRNAILGEVIGTFRLELRSLKQALPDLDTFDRPRNLLKFGTNQSSLTCEIRAFRTNYL